MTPALAIIRSRLDELVAMPGAADEVAAIRAGKPLPQTLLWAAETAMLLGRGLDASFWGDAKDAIQREWGVTIPSLEEWRRQLADQVGPSATAPVQMLRLPGDIAEAEALIEREWVGRVTVAPTDHVIREGLGRRVEIAADDARGSSYRIGTMLFLVDAETAVTGVLDATSGHLLSTKEVASIHSCHRNVVIEACRSGELAAHQVSRSWVIAERAAAAWRPGVVGWKKGRVRKA